MSNSYMAMYEYVIDLGYTQIIQFSEFLTQP